MCQPHVGRMFSKKQQNLLADLPPVVRSKQNNQCNCRKWCKYHVTENCSYSFKQLPLIFHFYKGNTIHRTNLLLLSPNHFVHNPCITLNNLYNPCRDIFFYISWNGNSTVSNLIHINSNFNSLHKGISIYSG